MSDYLDSNGLQRVWGKFKENISSYKTIENTSIASFSDGSNLPLKSLTADITAIQDLHGYDYPWVGGSGKNKLPMTVDGIKTANSGATWSGNSATINNVVFTIQTDSDGNVTGIKVSGTSSGAINFILATNQALKSGKYTMSHGGVANASGNGNAYLYARDMDGNVTLIDDSLKGTTSNTATLSNDIANVMYYFNIASGITMSGTILPQLELGQTATSYAPYSNICPISGWDECNVNVCGNNLFDKTHFQFVDMGYINGQGVWEGSRTIKNYPTDNIGNEWNSLLIDVSALRSQNVSFSGFVGSTAVGIIDENFTVLYTMGTSVPESGSVDLSQYSTAKYFVIGFYLIGYDFDNAQFELGSTATAYEPYNGHTYSLTFTDGTNPLTVYGGYVDLVSGLLTINKLGINVMSQEKRGWQIGSKSVCYRITLPQTATSCTSNQTHGAISNMMTEQLAYYGVSRPNDLDSINFAIDTSGVALAVYDTDLTLSEQQMISKYTDLFAVYPLATPLTYQLSKQQIKSLVGENNIFADTGAIKKVEYQPDNIVGELREDIYAIKIPIVIANVVSKSGNTVTLDKSLYQIIELAEAGYTVRVIDKVSSQIERFFYDLNYIYNSDQWKAVEFQNIMTFSSLSVRFKTLIAEDEGDGDTYQFDIISETDVVAPTPTSSDVNKSLKVNSDLDPYWSN